MVIEPDTPVELQYRADCPHCGDHSFNKSVRGGTAIGVTEKTIYTGSDIQGDVVYLRTAKKGH